MHASIRQWAGLFVLALPTALLAASFPSWIDLGGTKPGVTALQPAPDQLQLVFSMAGFALKPVQIEGETWHQPSLPGGALCMQKGAPSLPLLSGSVILPDTGAVTLRVTTFEHQDLTGIRIAPSKGSLPRTINPETVPYEFGPAYQQSQWPAKPASMDEPYILRDHRGATVRVCPFRYFPAEQRLRVFTRIVVELDIAPSERGINEISDSTRPAPNPEFAGLYARHFLNYDPSRALTYTPLADQGELLIIGKDALLGALQPLVDWKRQKGIRTTVVPLSSIGTSADQIKTYVQNYYNTNGLAFLLLVGDAEDVPTLSASGGSSDPSYSKLSGSDDYPDIFVGRFSGSTTQQIATMAARTIRYEKQPEAGGTWYRLATGIASDEGEAPSDIEHMNAIRTDLLARGYAAVDPLYDPGASKTTLGNYINAGRGLINYVGHGDVAEWVTTGFSNSDIGALTNTTRWPFIFDVACVNGQFAGSTCFAEAWLRAESGGHPSGALAIYASTINQEWSPPMTAQNEFNELLLAGAKGSFGGLCFNASMKMMDEWGMDGKNMFNTWTVFGDPSVQVRTLAPSSLAVTHAATLSSLSYTVQVAGVSGALAALSQTNHLLAKAYSGADGKAVITLSAPPSGALLLTVTSANAIPYTSTVHSTFGSALLELNTSSLAVEMEEGESRICPLAITNAGEAGSILIYSLSTQPDFSSTRAASLMGQNDRNLNGSALQVSPGTYEAGTDVALKLVITNASLDDEWIGRVTLRFPASITVNSATPIYTDNVRLRYNGAKGIGATAIWEGWDEGNYGGLILKGTGTVQISVSPSASGPLAIGWTLDGDLYGSEPHSITGVVYLATPEPLAASLTLTAPVGGETWTIGSTQHIAWTSIAYSEPVCLDASINGGASWVPMATGLPNNGAYSWVIDSPQGTNTRIRARSPDGAVASISPASFCLADPLDWISLSASGGAITGRQSRTVSVTLNAAGKPAGDYHAILRVETSAGVSNLPIYMSVLPSPVPGGPWTLQATAGENGSISPSGAITVPHGGGASFVITAQTGYFIAGVATNGHSTLGAAGLRTYTSVWNNVRGTGLVQATFASISGHAAVNNTPVPWLRDYYTTAASLAELEDFANQDTDGDGLLGWQECLALTDPTDASSFFAVRQTGKTPAGMLLQWWAGPGRTYDLYSSTNLMSGMQCVASNLVFDSTGMASYTGRTDSARHFYQLIVRP